MLSTVSLDARIFDNGSYRTPPVAPPRKKRSTLKKGSTLPINFSDDGVVINGFKDVFTNGAASRVLTYDDIEYIDKDESVHQSRASIENEEEKNRKLKVGNKKTDKFFGESLSDHLSDEPVAAVEERVEAEKSSRDELDRSSTSDKKLFFLMNMLEQEHEENEKYKDKVPVEEPLFIARKKEIKKHICDDDEHMHNVFHKHENEDCDHAIAPPKPDRDFSKYQSNSTEEEAKTIPETQAESPSKTQAETQTVLQINAQAKPRVMKSISRDSLPSPPAAPSTPKRKSGYTSLPGTPTITIESIDFPVLQDHASLVQHIEKVEAASEKIVKRPPALDLSKEPDEDINGSMHNQSPTTPILTHEIMDQMIKKAYGFHGYHPEDTEHNHDDGSNLVAPTSKLTTRKVSVGRKISTESQHSAYSTDSETISKINELLAPGSPRKKISFVDDPLTKISESHSVTSEPEGLKSPPKSPMKNRDFEKLLNATSMNDVIEEIYSKNSEIMKEFQSYLEKTVETHPVINVDQEKAFLIAKEMHDNEFIRTPEPPKISENEDEIDDNQSYSDSFESTDTEQETVKELNKIRNKLPKFNTRRRESIEDVDGWFNNHLDLEQKKSELCGSFDPQPNSNPGYDLQAVFPFGRTITGRRESLSDEFFTEVPQSLLKPSVGPLRESESSDLGSDDSEANKSRGERSHTSPDHSSLLKYFDKGSKENL